MERTGITSRTSLCNKT